MTGLARWIHERPPATIERLKKINQAATSSHHIILALSYAIHDPHIRAINKVIVAFLLSRHRAQRSGNFDKIERIECKLQEMHEAINAVTGTEPAVNKAAAENACKRVVART